MKKISTQRRQGAKSQTQGPTELEQAENKSRECEACRTGRGQRGSCLDFDCRSSKCRQRIIEGKMDKRVKTTGQARWSLRALDAFHPLEASLRTAWQRKRQGRKG